MRAVRNKSSIFLILLLTIAPYQSCDQVNFTSLIVSTQNLGQSLDDGNGQPYDGKLTATYYQTLPNYTCKSKPSPVATIEEFDSRVFQYSYNQNDQCLAATSITLPREQVDRTAHNPDFVGYRDGIFEKLNQPPDLTSPEYVEAWCQVDLSDPTTATDLYDVIVRYNTTQKTSRAEIYREVSGTRSKVGPFSITRSANTNLVQYTSENFKLDIDRSEPAPSAWWYFPGKLQLTSASRNVSQKMKCRISAGKLLGVIQKAFPLNGNWNDYVRVTDPAKDRHLQPEIACDGTESRRADCLHSAEYLRVATRWPNCTDLSIEEDLQAFQWTCENTPDGAQFLTKGLNFNRGLADLITPTGWKKNFVTIRHKNEVQYQSLPLNWWFNRIQAPQNNSSVGATAEILNGEGQIYVLSGTQTTAGYILGAGKQSFVLLPGSILSPNADTPPNCNGHSSFILTRCLLMSSGQQFLWIEGGILSDSTGIVDSPLALAMSKFSRVQNMRIEGGKWSGANLWVSHNSLFQNVLVSKSKKYGFYSEFSENTLFWNIEATSNQEEGIYLRSWDNNNSLIGARLQQNGYIGLHATASNDLVVTHSSAFSNGRIGFELSASQGYNHRFLSTISRNNNIGFWLTGTADGLFSNIAAIDNAFVGLSIMSNTSGPTDHVFSENLVTGGNPKNCQVSIIPPLGTSPGLLEGTCSDSGQNDSNTYAGQLSTAQLKINCRFDSNANVVNCGSWSSAASPLTAERICPAEAHGDQAVSYVKNPDVYYLNAAVELPNQDRGNNNGLCESHETCLYIPGYTPIPNDRGPGISTPCQFQDGKVAGVTLY